MKQVLFIIPFIIIFTNCNKFEYKCASELKQKNVCYIEHIETIDNFTTITKYVKKCSKEMKCDISTGNCYKPREMKDIDEGCSIDEDCIRGKCDPELKKCTAIPDGEICDPNSAHQCSWESNCKIANQTTYKCSALIGESENCNYTTDCKEGYVCTKYDGNRDNKCIKIHSVKEGKECNNVDACKSGQLRKINNMEYCVTMTTVDECSGDNENENKCMYTYIVDDRKKEEIKKVSCSGIGNKCVLGSDSEQWGKYIEEYTKINDKITESTTNKEIIKLLSDKKVKMLKVDYESYYVIQKDKCVREFLYQIEDGAYLISLSLFIVIVSFGVIL